MTGVGSNPAIINPEPAARDMPPIPAPASDKGSNIAAAVGAEVTASSSAEDAPWEWHGHVASLTFRVEARTSDVAAFLTLPSSWVKIMGLTDESRVEVGVGGDFKVVR